jgi:hypothetical protein
MNRHELERLDRDSLITRAEQQGVARAKILTRPELIDELLVKTSGYDDLTTQRARGFFGRARDLLSRVIERGLHLPDAAEMLRAPRALPHTHFRGGAAPLPTVTLAEIYAAQGHRQRAIDTLENVLALEPEHEAARAMLADLRDASYSGPKPMMPPEGDEEVVLKDEDEDEGPSRAEQAASTKPEPKPEPMGMLDDSPLPPKYDVDECIAIPVDPKTLFVYWEVRDQTREHLERTRPGGVVALRVLVIVPTWDGPRTMLRDQDVGVSLGDWFVRDLPIGAVVRAAIGWRVGDVFVAIAHSPALETPPGEPSHASAEVMLRWTLRGAVPIEPGAAEAQGIERALGRARVLAAKQRVLGGSSEQMIGAR